MDVRVGEPGHDDAAAEIDHLGRGERGLVDADAAGDPLAAIASARWVGICGSIVRTRPFSRITRGI